MSKYELWLTDDAGRRITDPNGRTLVKSFLSLTASRVINDIGKFTLTIPKSFDESILRPDLMVQVWRAPTGGSLGLWRVYFVRKWVFEYSGSREVITLEGPDTLDLLRRRIVAAYSGTAQASKADLADDMMKEVVTEALADGVAPTPTAGTRVWGDLSVASDLGDGPTVTQSFSFDKLLLPGGNGVMGQIANSTKGAGTEVFFDIVPNTVSSTAITFQFRTYTGQPGSDRTSGTNQTVFDQERGNMVDPRLEYDYSEEENYIYAAGQGEETDRNVQQVYDSARYGASQWNRCEGFADARNQDSDNAVISTGYNRLVEGNPRIRFSARPVDTRGTRFGRDWEFGDKVKARYRGVEFETIIRAVTIAVDSSGREDIQARLDYQS